MGRINDIFRAANGKPILMPFITGGFPSLAVTEAALPEIERAGASIVEIGFPFSDPIADGPVIAASMHEALEAGATPEAIFDVVRRVRPHTELGLIAMVSHSLVARAGIGPFFDRAAAAGIDGFIIPDIDIDAAREASAAADARDLAFSMLIAPTTTPRRSAELAALSRGFIYLLARVGITGERNDAPDVSASVAALRAVTSLPIAVGFGISRAEHVRAVTGVADAAIVGSALVRRMADASAPAEEAGAFVRSLAAGLR